MVALSTPTITGYTSDTGTSGDGITADRTLTFYGTGTPGASVEITDFGGVGTVAFLAAIPASGNWTLTVGDGGAYPSGSDGVLPDGVYNFMAGSRIGGDASSLSDSLSVTVAGPNLSAIDLTAASDTGSSSSDNYTSDATPTIEFTAGSGDTLEIDWDDGRGFQSVADGTGASQQFTNPNAYDPNIQEDKTVQVRSTKDGESTVKSVSFTYDRAQVLPIGSFTAASDTGSSQTDMVTNDTTPTIEGTGEVGAKIEVLLSNGSGSPVVTTYVDGAGNWTATLPTQADVTNQPLSIRATDLAGNTIQLSGKSFTIDTTAPAAPVISSTISDDTGSSSTDRITNDFLPRLTGTAELGTTVFLYDGPTQVGYVGVLTSGDWNLMTSVLSEGDHDLIARAVDKAGNVSVDSSPLRVTIDDTPPVPSTPDLTAASDTGTSDSDNATMDGTPTFAFTAEAGATLEVDWGAGDGFVSAGTGTGAAQTLTAPDYASDGSYTVSLRATDTAGNATTRTLGVTIDTTAPTVSALDLTAASDTGTSDSDNITSDTTPTIEAQVEAGAQILIDWGDGRGFVTGPVSTDGSVATQITQDVPYTAAGTYAVEIRAIDTAGNVATRSLAITIVDEPLAAPSITAISDDTGSSTSDHLTNDTTLILGGTSVADATIEVFLDGASVGTTTANGSGSWSFDHTGTVLADGDYVFTATATSAATGGVPSQRSAGFAVQVDGTAPGTPVVTGISTDTGTAGDGVTSDARLEFHGTAEAGAQVEVFLDTVSIGTVTVDGAGAWSLDHSGTALADGSYAVTAQARDAAGSLSGLSAGFAVQVDGTAPGTLSITGTPTEDQILTAVPTLSDDGGIGSISYQWMRNGTTIADATASTYTLTQADVGTALTLVARYTDESGTLETITSAATATVTNLNDTPTGDLTITGISVEDEPLTAGNTLADEDGLGPVSYQWLRDGSAITGATAASYTLTQADVGASLTVSASYTDAQGTAESVTSATTDAVIWADKILSGTSGDDYLRGRGGADQIFGLEGDDVLIGGFNDDILFGGTGDDTLHGWRGDDRLVGLQGNDQIFAGKGDDILRGGAGDDALFGRKNDDRLFGGLGDDRLKGGKGDDTLTGGKGADVFIFRRASGADVIADFGKGEDVIEILNGARHLGQIDFAQVGDDVVLHFAETEITVLSTTIDVLMDAEHFLFV